MEAPPSKKARYEEMHQHTLHHPHHPHHASPATLEYQKMRVSELRAELKKRGLKCSGNKPELIERLESDDNPIEFFDMAGDGKEKWVYVWMKVMMNLNHDSLFYSVFQGAMNQLLHPLMQASAVVLHAGSVYSDMLDNAMKGKGKGGWNEITEKQLEQGQMYAAAHSNNNHHNSHNNHHTQHTDFSSSLDPTQPEAEEMEDDGETGGGGGASASDDMEEDDPEKEEVHLNKVAGFRLYGLKIGSFLLKSSYPQQIRVKANVKKQQMEIYIFRFLPKKSLPKAISKFGARPSKQLGEFILKECNRFEISRWFRIIIPFNAMTGLHVYRNTPDEHNMITGTEGLGFLAFDLSSLPSFQTRRVSSQTLLQNEWRDRNDFTKGKAASKSEGRRYYLFGDQNDLAILIAMIALSKPDIPVQELLDRGLPDVGNTLPLHADALTELSVSGNSLNASRITTVPRPNFADLRQPLTRDTILFLAENKFLDLSLADERTRKVVGRYFKQKHVDEDEEDEEDDEEDEEEEEEVGRNLYKHIISGSNTCFTDFIARNHNNVEAIKKVLSMPLDLSKYNNNTNTNELSEEPKTVMDYMRSFFSDNSNNKLFPSNDQMYFSFCYNNFVDKQHGSHCEVCGQCADWRSWHCWNCNRCTETPVGTSVPVCEHCGNSSMSGPKFKTRPSSWRLSSVFTSGEFENGDEEEDEEAVRELCISESDDDEPPWPEPELRTDDVNKAMLMSLILSRGGTASPLADQNFQLNTSTESECILQ